MKESLLLILILFYAYQVKGQKSKSSRLVHGTIIDANNQPVPNAFVCAFSSFTEYCKVSDSNGKFEVESHGKLDSITVKTDNHSMVKFKISPEGSSDLNLKLPYSIVPQYRKKDNRPSFISIGLGVNSYRPGYESFAESIGQNNTDFIDNMSGFATIFLQGSYHKFNLALFLPIPAEISKEIDTIAYEIHKNEYKLSFGYQIISTTRFYIAPSIQVSIDKIRLLNYSKTRKTNLLNYYESNRELDLRFNQLIGSAGLAIAYFLGKKVNSIPGRFGVELYAGYQTNLTNHPLIYSAKNRLMTDYSLHTGKLDLAVKFHFRFNFNQTTTY